MEKLNIIAIPAPTIESESRKTMLQEESKHRVLTDSEKVELFNLEMRQFWNCEC